MTGQTRLSCPSVGLKPTICSSQEQVDDVCMDCKNLQSPECTIAGCDGDILSEQNKNHTCTSHFTSRRKKSCTESNDVQVPVNVEEQMECEAPLLPKTPIDHGSWNKLDFSGEFEDTPAYRLQSKLADEDLIQFTPVEFSKCVFQCSSFGEVDDAEDNIVDDDVFPSNNNNVTVTLMPMSRADDAFSIREINDDFDDELMVRRLPQVKSAAELSVTSHGSHVSMPFCRICHLPGNDEDSLISPCRCLGTMQYIHNGCLMKWLEISGKHCKGAPSCELCLYQYHRRKKFRVNHWQYPRCSYKDKVLHLTFIFSVGIMMCCAAATILCFKNDKGIRDSLDKSELTKSEVVTLICGVSFFIAFFVAMYVEVKSRTTIYKLAVTFLHMNQQWYIDEYDKRKDTQQVQV